MSEMELLQNTNIGSHIVSLRDLQGRLQTFLAPISRDKALECTSRNPLSSHNASLAKWFPSTIQEFSHC